MLSVSIHNTFSGRNKKNINTKHLIKMLWLDFFTCYFLLFSLADDKWVIICPRKFQVLLSGKNGKNSRRLKFLFSNLITLVLYVSWDSSQVKIILHWTWCSLEYMHVHVKNLVQFWWQSASLGGSVGCAVRLVTRRSQVQPPQHSFVEIDHEIFSTVILSLPLIQEGQLSVSGERMCTILVNRLED